jgi:hypothetical protein
MNPDDYRKLRAQIEDAIQLIRSKDARLSPFYTGLFDCLVTLRGNLAAIREQNKLAGTSASETDEHAAALVMSRDALAAAIDVLRAADDEPPPAALLFALASIHSRIAVVGTRRRKKSRLRIPGFARLRKRRTARPPEMHAAAK